MEVDDEYTKMMKEKLEKRREILLERSKKRRNEGVIVEDQMISSDYTEEESPKRQCISHVGEDYNKENELFVEDDYVMKDVAVRGLAALRRRQDNYDEKDYVSIPQPKVQVLESQVNIRIPSSTKSRLASLTAHVRDWEDESCKRLPVTNLPKTKSSGFSNIATSSFSNRSPNESNNNDALLESKSFVDEGKVSQKVNVWDKSIITSLESQGFVKSTSKAKLMYDFSKKQNVDESAIAKSSIVEEDEDEMDESSEHITANDEVPKLTFRKMDISQNQQINAQSVFTAHDVDKTTDPAELSLSARKALFEGAFTGNQSKPVGNGFDTSLSVIQRAAMFEKNAKAPRKVVTPVKVNKEPARFFNTVPSPIKDISPIEKSPQNSLKNLKDIKNVSPTETVCSSTPKEFILSPSKSASSHTRLMQQQLIDSSLNDWRKNEISAKTTDERKTEISALLNHWERVSASSNSVNVSNDTAGMSYAKSSSSENEPFQAELPINEDCKIENDSYEDQDEMESEHPAEETSCSNADDERSINSANITEHAERVFKELDNVLDAAIDSEISSASPVASMESKSAISDSSNSNGSYNSNSSNTSHKFTAMTPLRLPVCIPEDESEREKAPLLHTISFYRRQQKEKRATNVQTIVRRPEIFSPPSPQKPSQEMIEQKLQRLQAEMLAQQTVMSQTSQALNLCQAAEEFSSSTERVEAERLLLIATQKRMACENEILRIKTGADDIEWEGPGTLIINDLKLPLKQDFISTHVHGKGSDTVYYFLCLVRHGHQVIVTQMTSAHECVKNGNLEFSNLITLRNLSPNYSVMFEVWGLETMKEKLSHDRKYHIKRDSKMRLTPKSKKGDSSKLHSPAVNTSSGSNAIQKPSFAKIAFTQLTLNNSKRNAFALENATFVPFRSPLEGLLHLKMQLHVEHKVEVKGFLTMFEYVGDFGAWNRRWAVLNNTHIALWKYPEDENRKEPVFSIDLKKCVTEKVKTVSNTRKHTFQLLLAPSKNGTKNKEVVPNIEYRLAADSKEECVMWCKKLDEALANIRTWHPNSPQFTSLLQ